MTGHDSQALFDRDVNREVRQRKTQFVGAKWSLVSDQVVLPEGDVVTRDVVIHPGAVGVLALDELEQIVLIQQYRHPVAAELWELPAGLLDEAGESPLATANRELFEEAHLRADHWHVLVDLYSSPGMSSEVIRIYLARGLHTVPVAQRFVQSDEERNMPVRRVPLAEAVELVLGGQVHNAMAVAGILAAQQSRREGWRNLRSGQTSWFGDQ